MPTWRDFKRNATENLEANVDDLANKMSLSNAQMKGLTAMYALQNEMLDEKTGQLEILLTMLGGDK